MRAGKTAVATAFGQDVADIEQYQSTRWRPSIWTVGNDLVCVTTNAEPPKHKGQFQWEWELARGMDWFTKKYNLYIWRAINSDETYEKSA